MIEIRNIAQIFKIKKDLKKKIIRRRNFQNSLKRWYLLIKRYGFSSHRIAKNLDLFRTIMEKYDCKATLPITAVVLKRYYKLIKKLFQCGRFEFAIHGYMHNDYSKMPLIEQKKDIARAIEIFKEAGINAYGFRGPYLRYNQDTLKALSHLHLMYDSSQSILWNVLEERGLSNCQRKSVEKILEFYNSKDSDFYLSLPKFCNDIIEIPVSLPDDEILVDRLNFRPLEIIKIWNAILNKSYHQGGLFVLQIHPERINRCKEALEEVIKEARVKQPSVWIASLKEIAIWWKKRKMNKLEVLWPNGAKSAFSITGDIDAITKWDFIRKVFKV